MGLKFAHVEYSITTKSLDLFNIGCGKGITDLNDSNFDGCKQCCNPELRCWELDGHSPEFVLDKVKDLNNTFDKLVDRVLLVGGDPVDAYIRYPQEMHEFILNVRDIVKKPIYLFTRHGIEQIPKDLIELVDFVKVGAYIPELKCDDNIQYGIKLATSNQKIYKVSDL
jgi:anaerobic ribonucleoside-triphosphate reductase activating protein